MFLISSMELYLKESKEKAGTLIPTTYTDLQHSYKKLVSLGLGNTQNAVALKQQIDSFTSLEKDKATAQCLIQFVKEVKSHFGEGPILISQSQFKDLCNKYKLTIGPLSDYNGVIPVKNIEDLKEITRKIPSFFYKSDLNHLMGLDGHLLFVKRVESRYEDEGTIRKFLNDHNNVVAVNCDNPNFDGAWWASDIPELKKMVKWDTLNEFFGEIMNHQAMFIACPKKYLNNPEVKISAKPVDPLVFQYCPYGVLIYTVWGEEAEDVVLKKYMELNGKIASL